ncbi:TPA: type II secretion system major pseudopilin GspG [Escherichia coli]|nr:type II secretion system major pseudopilin GspG [Escherichia coli]HAY5185132.1 type II secretion system major pseudopilin GspG [Escherichia coli]HAY5648176.1 type II secretion system major pseudopilin GspG [Escherichia coli]
MALFYYQALERNGRKTKGMIEADSARHARQLLRGKELIPVHIEARMNTSSGGMLQRRRHAHRRVAAADLALFTRQLATLVQAAMPLETCLQAVSEQSEKLHVKSLGMALRSRIQEGYTLSDSLREHPRVFDSLFCSMVAAGEKSGHLDVVLNRLADYTEQRQRLKSRLLQAMLYPLVLLVVATGVVTILLTAVVPKIIEQFDHLGHALPASTRTLIAMSDALQASGVYWLAGLLGLLVLGQRLLKNPAMRLRWDKTVLRLPVTGRVARGLNTARFSRTLSILTASSVPLSRTQKPRAGFTLLEVMVVIVILGVLASLVVPNLLGNKEKADRQKAISDIVALENALDMYRLDNGRYPTTEQGLEALIQQPANMADSRNYRTGGYIKRLPKDPWGNDYQYLSPGEKGLFDVYTLGADGQENGEGAGADIGNWNLQEFQ